MIEAKDNDVNLSGTSHGVKLDFYNIVDALLDSGVYEDAGQIAVDIGRVFSLRNLSPKARLQMLFLYDVNRDEPSELMHEIGGGAE